MYRREDCPLVILNFIQIYGTLFKLTLVVLLAIPVTSWH